MFSEREKRLLSDDYFTPIRQEEQFIEVKSKNTKQCWMVFKKKNEKGMLVVVLYHKHKMEDAWYHEHYRFWTVKDAVKNIKEHDEYVMRNPDYLKKKGMRG